MLTKETRERLADYFDADELADYLHLSATDIIEAFEIEVEDYLSELLEIMGLGEEDD